MTRLKGDKNNEEGSGCQLRIYGKQFYRNAWVRVSNTVHSVNVSPRTLFCKTYEKIQKGAD